VSATAGVSEAATVVDAGSTGSTTWLQVTIARDGTGSRSAVSMGDLSWQMLSR
jgi:hypothetical protein